MKDLQLIEQRELLGKDFKIYGDYDSPLFLAKDVAEWIEHSDVSTMLRTVDEDEKLTQTMFVSGQNRELWLLTEDGLYEVLMQSRKPIAKQFKAQVKIILKDIRKHGMYAKEELLENPDLLISVATQLKKEKERIKHLEAEKAVLTQRVAEYEPKAQYVDTILSSPGTLTAAQIAADYGLSPNRLNKILHEEKVQHSVNGQWILYSKYLALGYTKSEDIPIIRSDGRSDFKLFTKWTQKGRLFIHGILEKRGIKANMDRDNNNSLIKY